MNENPTVEVSAFPDPIELRIILNKFKKGELDIEAAMYAIERLEEANIRFQNLALSQAQFRLMVEAKEEQHNDIIALGTVLVEGNNNLRKDMYDLINATKEKK